MDVTIYWNDRGDHPNAVERHSAPFVTKEGQWGCLRLAIMDGRSAGRERGIWVIGVEALHPKEGWRLVHEVLSVRAGGEEGLIAYLEGNVEAITVDGYSWWKSPRR